MPRNEEERRPLLSGSLNQTNSTTKWYRRPSCYWILPISFLFSITFGLTMTTRVNLFLRYICKEYSDGYDFPEDTDNNSDDMCNTERISAITSQFLLVINLFHSVPGAFTSGLLGSLSDRRGRRVVLLLSTIGGIFYSASIILASSYFDGSSFGEKVILFGAFLDGLGGSSTSYMVVSCAYVADCTTPEKRNVMFGWLMGLLYCGFTIGPMIAGWIVEATGSIISVFYIWMIVNIQLCLFILILPESLSIDEQLKNRARDENANRDGGNNNKLLATLKKCVKVLNIAEQLSILWPKTSKNNKRNDDDLLEVLGIGKYALLNTAIISFFFSCAMAATGSLLILYIALVFKLSVVEQGYIIFILGLSRSFTLVFIFPVFLKYLRKAKINKHHDNDNSGDGNSVGDSSSGNGNSNNSGNSNNDLSYDNSNNDDDNNEELKRNKKNNKRSIKELLKLEVALIKYGALIEAVSYTLYGAVNSGIALLVVALIASSGSVIFSTLKSFQTNLVPTSRTGELLGALAILISIANIVSPTFFNALYSIFTENHRPYLVWYFVGAAYYISYFLASMIRFKDDNNISDRNEEEEVGRKNVSSSSESLSYDDDNIID